MFRIIPIAFCCGAVVLMVTRAGRNNFADERGLQYEMLKQNCNVKVLSRSGTALKTCATKNDQNCLIV